MDIVSNSINTNEIHMESDWKVIKNLNTESDLKETNETDMLTDSDSFKTKEFNHAIETSKGSVESIS